jgi:hypothetical protein
MSDTTLSRMIAAAMIPDWEIFLSAVPWARHSAPRLVLLTLSSTVLAILKRVSFDRLLARPRDLPSESSGVSMVAELFFLRFHLALPGGQF